MSLIPYWARHLRNLACRDPVMRVLEDPFTALSRDPFFRDPLKYMRQMSALDHDHSHGIDGVLSETEVKADGKKVEVHLDVQNFTPDQIQVKTVGNEITVEGKKEVKKEVKKEGGWTRSHFERRFLLPEGFPPERVECHLDKGRLVLVAFRAQPVEERTVPIQDKTKDAAKS